MFFRFLEFCAIIMFIGLMMTQIIIPLFTQTILFPMVRSQRSHILDEMKEIKAQLTEAELQVALDNLKAQLRAKQAEQVKSIGVK